MRITCADPYERTITGTLLVYGQPAEVGPDPKLVEFQAGCAQGARARDILLLMQHDHDRPIGRAVQLRDGPQRMSAVFRVADTPLGDQALAEAAEGVRTGLSVGAWVVKSRQVSRGDEPVELVTALQPYEVSLVTFPAFPAARVVDITGRKSA